MAYLRFLKENEPSGKKTYEPVGVTLRRELNIYRLMFFIEMLIICLTLKSG